MILFFISFTACRNNKKELYSKLVKEQIFDEVALQRAIAFQVEHLELDTLAEWYTARGFKAVWALKLADSNFIHELDSFYMDLEFEGLNPDWYGRSSILEILPKLSGFLPSDSLYRYLAQAECLISLGLIQAHKEHATGCLNPIDLFGKKYGLPIQPQFYQFNILHPDSFRMVYHRSRPNDPEYDSLCALYSEFRKLELNAFHFSRFDTLGVCKLVPGDSTDLMPVIARKLFELGLMTAKDTTKASRHVYNRAMLPYIRNFQTELGLFNDGTIGTNTLIHLNKTTDDFKNEIIANLERIRWFQADSSQRPFIRVNLPEYKLYMHYVDSTHDMGVCVGKQNAHNYDAQYAKYLKSGNWRDQPKNFETPQISSRISHVVLNPTWTVPASIVAREMYPSMIRDPNYLKKNRYVVLYKDKPHPNPDTIRWKRYKANMIPFKFVQESGLDNALGKIKFMFPNPYHIYLHDTPQKSKFRQNERSVSHGCVRVENPLQLLLFLDQNIDQYNADDLRIMMGYAPEDSARLANWDPQDTLAKIKPIKETISIFLNRRMTVYFDYRTIWWDVEGKRHWQHDVYRKNYVIGQAMRKKTVLKL